MTVIGVDVGGTKIAAGRLGDDFATQRTLVIEHDAADGVQTMAGAVDLHHLLGRQLAHLVNIR